MALFQKSASDMIKGVRAHPRDEANYVATCITEIKEELKSTMQGTKQQAVLKLVYLEMMGYDVSWASFHFVDVMSFPRFRGKRIGFLAAQQSFHSETDVLLLTTNLFRRAFASSTPYEVCLGVTTLAKIATPELSRDLLTEVSTMLSSSRSLVRKKAVLALYRLLLHCPETLPNVFPRLREKLDDPDPAVVACAVNVLVELAAHNPKGYLGLAPPLYRVLTSSGSNWTLIKVVKFMRQLVPHEPRLGKKLVEPLLHLIQTTQAKSLQYECLATVAATMTAHAELTSLAASKLREFVTHDDPNLKFLGLVALAKLQDSDRRLVEGCRDIVLECITTDDPTVRSQALALVAGMVSKDNLTDIVAQLMRQLDSPDTTHRDELVAVVLKACRCDGFAHVPSFKWLVSCLITLLRMESAHGGDAADQLVEVALRVPAVRGFAAERCQQLLLSAAHDEFAAGPPPAALRAAAITLAEHGPLLPKPAQLEALRAMLAPAVDSLAPQVQAAFMQAATRLFSQLPLCAAPPPAAVREGDLLGDGDGLDPLPLPSPPPAATSSAGEADGELLPLLDELLVAMPRFCASEHVEVQERALCLQQLLLLLQEVDAAERAALYAALRDGLAAELKAVAPNAQRKVRVPRGLDLDAPIYEPPPEPSPEPAAGTFAPEPEPMLGTSGGGPEAVNDGQPQQQQRRPQPSGVFYLQASQAQEAATAVVAAAEAASTGAPSAEPATLNAGVAALSVGGGMPAWGALAPPETFDDGGAVINMDDAMPSDAEDDEEPVAAGGEQHKHGHRRADYTPIETPATDGSLIDLLGDQSAAASGTALPQAAAEPTKRRRRRHRTPAA